MKSNFNPFEVSSLANAISANTNLSMRINKYGNIDVAHKNASEVHFVFYKRNDGYFIRRRLGVYRGISQHGGVMNGGKHFSSMKEMVAYFTNYLNKYPTHLTESFRRY